MRSISAGLLVLFWLSGGASVAESEGSIDVGKQRFEENCTNCHGPGGMGLASYPRVGGKDADYIKDRLETYRAGEKIGPNSALMIMMAKPLSDEEITNIAAYLSSVQFDN